MYIVRTYVLASITYVQAISFDQPHPYIEIATAISDTVLQ